MNHPHWIQTRSGKAFDLLDPQPDMICIEDIAHSLSMTCRFTGQCSRFYSVAEHSILCMHAVSGDLQLQALMHDSAEAYLGDVSSPLKALLPEYRMIEKRVWRAIADKFGLPEILDPNIKRIDILALGSEWGALLAPPVHPLTIANLTEFKPEMRSMVKEHELDAFETVRDVFLYYFRFHYSGR